MIEDEPYTYDELDELFRRDGNNDYIGLSVIDGLIAALVAGPATVPPREWLPLIYADKMPSTVKGHPESRSKATIMARYAEVEQILALHPAGYQPIFMHDRGRFIIRPWGIGFMMGISKGMTAWTPLLLGEHRKMLTPILASNELGRRMLPELSDLEIANINAVTEVPQIAGAVRALSRHVRTSRPPGKLATLRKPARRAR
jgi:yecA family protein